MDLANLADAEPFTTIDGSTIRELAGRVALPAAHQSLAEATVPPGGATMAHYHPVSEELYFFTSGAGRLRLDGEEREVRPGDCAVIAPGTEHKLFNTGQEPLVLLCCCSPAYANEDTVLTEGPPRMARNDPTDTGGLFIGRRPGTAPLSTGDAGAARRAPPAGRRRPGGRRAGARALIALSCWGPQPLAGCGSARA